MRPSCARFAGSAGEERRQRAAREGAARRGEPHVDDPDRVGQDRGRAACRRGERVSTAYKVSKEAREGRTGSGRDEDRLEHGEGRAAALARLEDEVARLLEAQVVDTVRDGDADQRRAQAVVEPGEAVALDDLEDGRPGALALGLGLDLGARRKVDERVGAACSARSRSAGVVARASSRAGGRRGSRRVRGGDGTHTAMAMQPPAAPEMACTAESLTATIVDVREG